MTSLQPYGWRKSSRSNRTHCVEVGRVIGGGAAVRDTKNCAAGYFSVRSTQWASFVDALKSGAFDR